MKKPGRGRFGIGTGTKIQQANLRKLAKKMERDPGMLIPACSGECSNCRFDKIHNKLRKIQSVRTNPKALGKMATGGRQLERGYAAMLILAREDTPIMFAQARLPSGDVGYTVRGKMKKETLIGLQHFDDPVLRLLAYLDIALKKKLHLYSFKRGLTCTGRKPGYPKELLDEVMASTSYNLRKKQGYQCEHMSSNRGQSLEIRIESLDVSIRLCKECTSRKTNLYNEISGRVLAKRPEDDFTIIMEHDLNCNSGNDCSLASSGIDTGPLLEQYRRGGMSDRELLDSYSKQAREAFEALDKRIFVLGSTCYEDDHEAFIEALGASEIEAIALKRMLKSVNSPVIMETGTPNAVLGMFWEKLGASAIHAAIGDKELASKIYKETRGTDSMPSMILRDAKIRSKSKNVLATLPDLKNLGRYGRYVDELARTYKAMGREDMVRGIDLDRKETKFKSINCGFLKALDAIKGKEWHFTKEELEYGDYLRDFALELLNAEPGDYKDKLQNLLTASGCGETVS